MAISQTHPSLHPSERTEPSPPSSSPGRSSFPKFLKAALALALVGGLGYLASQYPEEARRLWHSVTGEGKPKSEHSPVKSVSTEPTGPWDGFVTVTDRALTAMGLATVEVEPQSKPIRLELLGTTAYMTDTLTKVRPMFKGRVDKVHVVIGQAVKQGEPLIELYSKDLAEAKSAYQVERIQWLYDKNLLNSREPLLKSHAISQQVYDETKNNEMKSRREYEVARDKLLIYGLSDAEVDEVDNEVGASKARVTLRSRADGFVIERDVVPGNLYDDNDTLLVIAPLDRLWVWGHVFESDLDLVKLGQSWEIRFPFLEHQLHGKVELISNRVDPDTHAVKIRTSIPNPGQQLKSDMLVRGMLEIPPVPGRTVIPRTALIVDDGRYCVFVRRPGEGGKYERRRVVVAQEKDDHVVIDHGLKVGETIVSVGALILAQIYEDSHGLESGAPSHENTGAD
ncbi:efflux RND transporter periplasmic adaptor subunit [Singulisphaera acidiphila]|uniref:RND family efflux transporter, MFP subunit n=1 Tax=Singulisphaera acidiphila (strain ATCC BAA-1392 / DSM 18658 / VKM B-2454 / MOB10) TaxID=886293 RepID=L0DJA3_SINAD|nr:efflux RND transporter periplasmic adaptor subunit [Singulisphaera acidiphila]AGA28761.1 RND family efflux transporter, MFP subunit [Singulisphaera acidiphila DSM 18658]